MLPLLREMKRPQLLAAFLAAVIVKAAIAAAGGGSGAEPEPATLELWINTQTGRDILHKALGPAATTRPLSLKSGEPGGFLERKAGTIAF